MTIEYRELVRFCRRYRGACTRARAVNGVLLVAALFFGVSVLLGVAFALFPWTWFPVLWDFAVVCAAIACMWQCATAVIGRPSLAAVARMLEKQAQREHHYLSIGLELGESGNQGSRSLVDAVCVKARDSFLEYPGHLSGLVRRGRAVTAGVLGLVMLAVMCLATPGVIGWWDMPLVMLAQGGATLDPGSLCVPLHTTLTLRCAPKQTYPSARLHLVGTSPNSRWERSHLLLLGSDANFSFVTDPLTESFSYGFVVGGKSFGPESVTVVPPPTLYSLRLEVRPPGYTRLAVKALPEGQGSMTVYPGTRVRFSLRSHFPLREARRIVYGADTTALDVDDGIASGEVAVWREGRYSFQLVDTLGQESDSLPDFYVSLLPDYGPAVRIVRPGENRDLAEAQRETLSVQAVDDFGVRSLFLEWTATNDDGDSVYRRDILGGGKGRTDVQRTVCWDLTSLSLYPGDTVFYWVRVRDIRPHGGPQVSVSETFWFRVPSFREIHERIARRERQADDAISSVKDLQERMLERLESLVKSAQGKEELSWEEKEVLKDVGRSIKEQSDSLTKAISALEDAVRRMEESGVSSREILDKMNEVREALAELLEEYGDSLMFEPPSENDRVTWQEMRDAVDKMRDMMPELKERLENAMEYLEMLREEGERARLAARASKLAQEQAELAASGASEEQRLGRQQDLTDRTGDLADDVGAGAQGGYLRESDVPSLEHVVSIGESMRARISEGAPPASSTMNRMSGALQGLSEELQATLSSEMAAKTMRDRERLLAAAGDMLDLATWQEELSEVRDDRLAAASQQEMAPALQDAMDRLDSLEIVPPRMLQGIMARADAAAAALHKVLGAIGGRGRENRISRACMSLDVVAEGLLAAAKGLQGPESSGGGACGMMCGLRRLSGKQAAVNAATAGLLQQLLSGAGPHGTRPGESAGGAAEQAREAAERAQQQIAERLKELAGKYGKESDKGLNARVEELEKEARRLAAMLERPTPDVSERQDRFLARMLQTTLSLHRQDEGKEKRKSQSAVAIFTTGDAAAHAQVFRDTDTFFNLRSRALRGNYPDTYRYSIQTYFDSLGVLFLRQSE